jgi:hypothetical protein
MQVRYVPTQLGFELVLNYQHTSLAGMPGLTTHSTRRLDGVLLKMLSRVVSRMVALGAGSFGR